MIVQMMFDIAKIQTFTLTSKYLLDYFADYFDNCCV